MPVCVSPGSKTYPALSRLVPLLVTPPRPRPPLVPPLLLSVSYRPSFCPPVLFVLSFVSRFIPHSHPPSPWVWDTLTALAQCSHTLFLLVILLSQRQKKTLLSTRGFLNTAPSQILSLSLAYRADSLGSLKRPKKKQELHSTFFLSLSLFHIHKP